MCAARGTAGVPAGSPGAGARTPLIRPTGRLVGKLRLSPPGVPLRFRASMGIADLFRPKYRHSDVRVRTEAVRALTADDAAILVQIARTDSDTGVRRLAIERIATADVLADI